MDQVSIQLAYKRAMKAKGLSWPDDADALACTFAEPVLPVDVFGYLNLDDWSPVKPFDRYAEVAEAVEAAADENASPSEHRCASITWNKPSSFACLIWPE